MLLRKLRPADTFFGGTAGYIWGTDGTDGILRMSTSMSWTKDAGNAYVTLAVGTVDCGTF